MTHDAAQWQLNTVGSFDPTPTTVHLRVSACDEQLVFAHQASFRENPQLHVADAEVPAQLAIVSPM